MPTKIEITCFTDLKGSTAMTEEMGHADAIPIIQEHLRVGQALAALNKGTWVKNIGDAHMVRFDYVEDALAFAVQLQQLCSEQPALVKSPVPVRISLFLGAVEPIAEDVFGSGVNQAARLQGVTEPAQVTVNDDLYKTMQKAFGKKTTGQYCISIGTHELKGVPGQQHLYRFDWSKYVQASPVASLASYVYEHLKQANIEASNLSAADINRPGQVIWPVVPRDLATAIHRGQVELIRLLTLIGWQVTVLIADCGGETEYEDVYVDAFTRCIETHVTRRGIRLSKTLRMSKMYEPAYPEYNHIQMLFRRITSQMTVEVLMKINTKRYTNEVKSEIEEKPTLTYLRPPLTLAAVLHLAETEQTKCVVIAGSDETLQWNQAYNMANALSKIGVLMIPVVNIDPEHQVYQRKRFPIWHSEEDVVRQQSGDSNVIWWLFRLLAFLPAFPERHVIIEGKTISPGMWTDGPHVPDDIDITKLVNYVWPLLDPA
jgi:hypothetical protein